MSAHFIRMIQRARYQHVRGAPADQPSCDAVTDLRTTDQSLSVWQMDPAASVASDDRLLLAVLGAQRPNLSPLDLVSITEEFLASTGIELRRTPGNVQVASLNERHFDLVNLTIAQLSALALTIMQASLPIHRVSQPQLRDLIKGEVNSGKIERAWVTKGVWQKVFPQSGD